MSANPGACEGMVGCVHKGVGYLRVSTSEQASSGLGLDAQQAAIQGAAERLGVPLLTTFVDAGVSGGLALEQRPALLAALEAIGAGDALIIAKRDRLGRSVLNVAMIERLVERKGARIVSAAGEGSDDDGPTSRLMRQIIDAFAEYERAVIRSRTRAAMQAKKRRGERAGHVPFGWRVGVNGRTLERHDAEQATLALLRELRAAGYTLRALAAELNQRGIPTRRNGHWSHEFVFQLLARHATDPT